MSYASNVTILVHSEVKNRPLQSGDGSGEEVYTRQTSSTSHKVDQNFTVSDTPTGISGDVRTLTTPTVNSN